MHDARSRLIFLTDRGKAARPIAVTAGDRVEEHWAELTSPEEIESLRVSLLHLVQRINQAHLDQSAGTQVTGVRNQDRHRLWREHIAPSLPEVIGEGTVNQLGQGGVGL